MKTFDTFEKLDGMLLCKKKPIIVHCIQINEPFRVNSLEGDYKQGKVGDYLMRGIDGELYICDKDIFERSYDIIEEERSQEGLTLGELIDTLRSMPPDTKVSNLTYPHSYRGYYTDLAFEKKSGTRLACELLFECESALESTFYGYRGGEYGMNMETSVWIADYGSTGERLIGLGPDGTIETKFLN
jgi:hypothetical protein